MSTGPARFACCSTRPNACDATACRQSRRSGCTIGCATRQPARRCAHLCAADEHATLVEHERLSDAELAIALSRLDVYVLPYRHGTHSGWLEFCWDLGVPVAVPLVGYYAEQHPDGSVATFAPGSGADLSAALARLLSGSDVVRAGTAERADIVAARREARRRTDAAAAAAHAALYRRLLAGWAP